MGLPLRRTLCTINQCAEILDIVIGLLDGFPRPVGPIPGRPLPPRVFVFKEGSDWVQVDVLEEYAQLTPGTLTQWVDGNSRYHTARLRGIRQRDYHEMLHIARSEHR